jgi:hypothetical protein
MVFTPIIKMERMICDTLSKKRKGMSNDIFRLLALRSLYDRVSSAVTIGMPCPRTTEGA